MSATLEPHAVRWVRLLNIGSLNLVAILVCTGIWTYRNSLDGPGILDDAGFISQSLAIEDSGAAKWIPKPRQYARLSVLWNHSFGETKVRGYRQVNRLIHVVNALLLFGCIRCTLLLPSIRQRFDSFSANSLAFCVSLIWLVHPLQTQAVTYMAQRIESMMATCFLLGLYCLVRATTSSRQWLWYVGCAVAFVVGVGTKEVIAMLPFVMLLYDRAFLASTWKDVFRQRWGLYAFLLVPMFLFAVWIAPYFSSRTHNMGFGHPWITPWMYARTQAAVIFHYLRLVAWPDELCLDYCWPVMSVRESLPWVVLMAGVLVCTVASWVRNPQIGFLPLSFFLILAPTSSVMPINDLAFEHRMYLPLACAVGVFVFSVYFISIRICKATTGISQLSTGICCALSLILAVPLTLRTVDRNRDYQSEIGIWESALRARPESHRARLNYAAALMADGQEQQSVENMKLSFQHVCKNWPDPDYITSYFFRVQAGLNRIDQEDQFIPFMERVNVEFPGNGTLSMLLGDLYYLERDYPSAITAFERATSHPAVAERAELLIPAVRMADGDIEGCVLNLYDQIVDDPLDIQSINFLSWILSAHPLKTVRDGTLAVQLSERVCLGMEADDAVSWGTLASAYAETGDFEKAEWASKKAIQCCWDNPGSGELSKNREQLAGYREQKACRMDDQAAGLDAIRSRRQAIHEDEELVSAPFSYRP